MLSDFILPMLQIGTLLIILGIIGLPLTVITSLFKKDAELKWMIRSSIGAIGFGILILVVVWFIGGIGAFNA